MPADVRLCDSHGCLGGLPWAAALGVTGDRAVVTLTFHWGRPRTGIGLLQVCFKGLLKLDELMGRLSPSLEVLLVALPSEMKEERPLLLRDVFLENWSCRHRQGSFFSEADATPRLVTTLLLCPVTLEKAV